jgi:hypothetical protein
MRTAPVVPNNGIVRHSVKAYLLLGTGAIWLIAAIFLYRVSFGFVWLGEHDPALALRLASMVLPVLFLGWIAPVLFGAWLPWKK